MAEIQGTNVAAKIAPFTTDDTYATHVSTYGQGGWHEVSTIQERNAIPADRRIAGMAVLVTSESKLYTLNANLTTWSEFETGKIDVIQKNGTTLPIANKTVNITVPTDTSDLTNNARFQNASEVESAIGTHNVDAEAHEDIRAEIQALNEFTADTIVPTTTNFVPTTTYTVDEALQRTANLFGGIQGEIDDINGLIPNQATTSNQLADKAFVNSTVATNSANFRGNWATWSDVPSVATDYPVDYTGSKTPTNNDYMTVSDASGYNVENTGSWRFIYTGDWTTNGKNGWHPQYPIGTAFTAAQQAAIDSGITSTMVENYVNPTSTASTAYNARITALETDKVDKIYTASKVYGTNSLGAQIGYQAGSNIEFNSNGLINVIGVQQQIFVMPEATVGLLGAIVQYMGETNATYTHGVMYQCVPVYGDYTATYVSSTISNVVVDTATFDASNEYVPGTLTYTFTCTNGGLRQQWRLPSGMSTRLLGSYGISYTGRAAANDTITITKGIVGYTWEAYAGISSGNDKIRVVGDKVYAVNVVGQYNMNTCPGPTEDNAGMIIQWTGESTLLDIRTPGYFYQCQEDARMRDYSLSADPNKYSSLYISDWITLDDFARNYENNIVFKYDTMDGWKIHDDMLERGTPDLTTYGISYTLNDGETLAQDDTITINIVKSYVWRNIQVQPNNFIVDFLPEANMENWAKVVFLAGSDMLSPIEGYPFGKWYRCVERYNETTDEWYYEWEMLPGQDGLQQLSELPTDNIGIVSDGQCICYVGEDNVEYENDFETIYLRKGHIYRAVVTDADDDDFLHINYYETYTGQFNVMPYPFAEYEDVITQYTGEDGDYIKGHFYKCVPTGNMTDPLAKQKHEGDWSVSIDPTVLETQVSDPTEPMKFTFQSQAEGAQWHIVQGDVYTTVDLADYGITITGEVPYGSRLYVKYIEPQPEYKWEQIDVQPSGGSESSIQVTELPDPDLVLYGKILQYIGEDTEDYTNGYFYKCVGDIPGVGDLSCTSNDGGFEESVELDVEQFEDYVQPEGSYNQSFTYVEADDSWCLTDNPEEFVNIADYGVSYPAPPYDGIWLELHYTPGIPLSFRWKQWNTQPTIQRTEFITESEDLKEGDIVQYVGDDTEDYTHGYFYQAIETSITETSLTYKYIGTGIESITVDKSSFESMVQPTEDMVLTFHYVTADYAWYDENSEEIDPANYGVSITGQPQDGDVIKLIYKVGRPVYDWQQVNTQPLPLASEFPNYDVTKKQMLVHNANSDIIEWEDI